SWRTLVREYLQPSQLGLVWKRRRDQSCPQERGPLAPRHRSNDYESPLRALAGLTLIPIPQSVALIAGLPYNRENPLLPVPSSPVYPSMTVRALTQRLLWVGVVGGDSQSLTRPEITTPGST